MSTSFAELALTLEPNLVESRALFLEMTPHPEQVTRVRPEFTTELATFYSKQAVGLEPEYPQQHEEVSSAHYADSWLRYIHPACSKLKHHRVDAQQLTQEVLDLGQALISEACQANDWPLVLLEEMIHEQETKGPMAPGSKGYVSLPVSWCKNFSGSNLDAFLAWLQYWLLTQSRYGHLSSPREEIPISELDPLTWWGPTMTKLYEEVCRRRSRSLVDHKLALSRDLFEEEVTMEVGNRFGFSGLRKLVSRRRK